MAAEPLRPMPPDDPVVVLDDRLHIRDLVVDGAPLELAARALDTGESPETVVRTALELGASVLLHGAAKGTVDAVASEVDRLLALLTEKSRSIEALGRVAERASSAPGLGFEERIASRLEACFAPHEDEVEGTGGTQGIANEKTGDYVVTLSPRDTGGRERRIVFELKRRKARTTVASALDELDRAMLNRGAQVAVMVFANRAASPLRGKPLRVYHGNRILLVWNPDEPDTDLVLDIAAQLARTLAIAAEREDQTLSRQVLAERLDRLVNVIERGSAIRRGIATARRGLDNSEDAYERLHGEALAVIWELQDLS